MMENFLAAIDHHEHAATAVGVLILLVAIIAANGLEAVIAAWRKR